MVFTIKYSKNQTDVNGTRMRKNYSLDQKLLKRNRREKNGNVSGEVLHTGVP